MALAVALLPFGHTVYMVDNGAVDKDRTGQLNIMHQVVYTWPYYLFMILFSIMLFVVFVGVGHTYNQTPWKNADGSSSGGSMKQVVKIMKCAMGVRSTFGFYFRLDNDKYKKMTEDMGQSTTNGNDDYD